MAKKQNSNLVYTISVLILLLFIGCSVEKQHTLLTTFFDGVDKEVVAGPKVSKDSLARDAMAKRDNLMQKVRPDKYTHKPYQERKCENCHKQDDRGAVKNLPELLMPLPDLCFKCHNDFRKTYQYVHGPVASGGCLKCHNQHYASYPKLLTREGQQICTTCHNGSDLFRNRFHRNIEDANCTMCHNPHGSNRRYMLNEAVAKFGGMDMADQFASKHITGQIYNRIPGDIGGGIPVEILNDKNQIVASLRTDSTGHFSMENIHPNQDYSIKFKLDSPSARINLYDHNNNLLSVVDRGKKGKYNFDREAYERTHIVMRSKQPIAPPPAPVAPAVPATTAAAPEKKEPATETAKEPTTPVEPQTDTAKPVAAATEQPTTTEQPKEAPKEVPKEVPATEPTTATGTQPTEKLPDLGGAVTINNNQDFATVKLSGKTFHFNKGTVVCVLDDFGGVVAIAKVDGNGNFVMDKPTDGQDTSIYSQILFLNSNTNEVRKALKTNPGQYMTVGGIEGGPVTRIDKLRNDPGDKNEALLTVVYYQYKSAELTEAGLDELDKVITFLDNNPDVNVSLNAYTDARGSNAANQKLSDSRAKAVKDYLVSQGIEQSRIEAHGLGETNPVNKCKDGVPCKEAEHAENRRVEIFITDKNLSTIQK